MLCTIEMIEEITRKAMLCNKKKQPSEKKGCEQNTKCFNIHPKSLPEPNKNEVQIQKKKEAKTLPKHTKNEIRNYNKRQWGILTFAGIP